jgi:8-oxo-dGTP pyrophosphatase MutT (NUDIX family)
VAVAAPDLAKLREAFARTATPEPTQRAAPHGVSAVLLALYDTAGEPELLYTRRTETMRSHPGEISFPGGRVEAQDASPLHAALREADEEVGIPPADVATWGHLTDFLTHRDVLVCAYVGEIAGPEQVDPATRRLVRPGRRPPTTPRSAAEVAQVFTVPLRELLSPETYEARTVEGLDRRVHYWRVGGRVVWGITGELTARFLARTCGWTPPSEPRVIHEISEFRP